MSQGLLTDRALREREKKPSPILERLGELRDGALWWIGVCMLIVYWICMAIAHRCGYRTEEDRADEDARAEEDAWDETNQGSSLRLRK
jgi:hypothetical protein